MKLALLIALLGIFSVQSTYSLEGISGGNLPSARTQTGLYYDPLIDEDSIYILGGTTGARYTNEVVKYSLATEETSIVGFFGAGVSRGLVGTNGEGTFYYIGGYRIDRGYVGPLSNIYSLTTANPDPNSIGLLPDAIYNHAGASDGNGNVYIIGGVVDDLASANILKLNTATHAVTHSATLPNALSGMSAVLSGESVYAFGGYEETYGYSSKIFKYTPAVGLQVLQAEITGGFSHGTAVTAGDYIYIILGQPHSESQSNLRMLRLNTATEELVEVEVENVESFEGASAAYVPHLDRIYVFGGSDPLALKSDITYFQLTNI